ncbi:DUF6377 domain-containing protein [Chitinophaga sp.]|uniref:DUF6377 domain-containing protein n=1 Tax=Chitinophaga sp. TaxID=1869181 RepID=UPI0031DB0E45
MNRILFITVFLLSFFRGYAQHIDADSLIDVLKTELKKEGVYDQGRQNRIAVLRDSLLLADSNNFDLLYRLYSGIYDEYSSFKFDSAYVYVKKRIALAEQFHKKDELIASEIQLGYTLYFSGFYKEAFDVIGKMDTLHFSKTQRSDYLTMRARLNQSIADYDNDPFFSKGYYEQSDLDFRSAQVITPFNEFEKKIDMAFLPDSIRPQNLTPDYFFNLIIQQDLSPHRVAMVATRISAAYRGKDRVMFLALAAIGDIRSSTKETLAIFLLAQELYHMNQTNDAYIFMQAAARNANFYGTRNRAVQIESLLPMVAGKVIAAKQHQRDKLLIGFLTFLIVAVVLFFLLFIYRKQLMRIKASEALIKEKNTQLENVNEQLWESSKIKEELIGLFLKTCSSYIETLERMKQSALHSIKLKKYGEVNDLMKGMDVKEEKERLYTMLDTVFLTMFPNFITSFNGLLKPEDQIWPRSGETLNATLRIFALMRLGIHEHEAIAKILDYSVSTVYTYKTRIKSRALVPANDFEHKIMEIKFINGENG